MNLYPRMSLQGVLTACMYCSSEDVRAVFQCNVGHFRWLLTSDSSGNDETEFS